jgi:hypothetical protein
MPSPSKASSRIILVWTKVSDTQSLCTAVEVKVLSSHPEKRYAGISGM